VVKVKGVLVTWQVSIAARFCAAGEVEPTRLVAAASLYTIMTWVSRTTHIIVN